MECFLHTFPTFVIWCIVQSAHCLLLICCKQILEMAYEWLHYHRNKSAWGNMVTTLTSSWTLVILKQKLITSFTATISLIKTAVHLRVAEA